MRCDTLVIRLCRHVETAGVADNGSLPMVKTHSTVTVVVVTKQGTFLLPGTNGEWEESIISRYTRLETWNDRLLNTTISRAITAALD